MKPSAWKLKSLVTVLVLLGLFAFCPCGLFNIPRTLRSFLDPTYVSGYVDPLPFDRDLWLAGKARHRVGMANYLVANKALNEMSRTALIEMLGTPNVDQPGDEGICWLLGYLVKGLFDEELWLEVTVTPEGVVADAAVNVEWGPPHRR